MITASSNHASTDWMIHEKEVVANSGCLVVSLNRAIPGDNITPESPRITDPPKEARYYHASHPAVKTHLLITTLDLGTRSPLLALLKYVVRIGTEV
jgi:hypothetical protein